MRNSMRDAASLTGAKSGCCHGGARQGDRSFADELSMGPRSRASHDTSDTASPEVISCHR